MEYQNSSATSQKLTVPHKKIVVCESCLHYDHISEFYNGTRYCLECLSDHACCPVCKSGYHAVNI